MPAVLMQGLLLYAELVFFPSGGRTGSTHFAYTHGGMARLSWPGWLIEY